MKILAVISMMLTVSACSTDNRQRIAMETLYPEHAPAVVVSPPVHDYSPFSPAPVLTGALNEKFPPGTDVEELKKYVAKFDGKCEPNQQEQVMSCSFIETGTICSVTEVIITAKTTLMNKIGHIVAYREHNAC